MHPTGLPLYLPEWEGAEEALKMTDLEDLHSAVAKLVDLMFSEESGLLDLMPDDFQTNTAVLLSVLCHHLENSGPLEVLVAARLVRHASHNHLEDVPRKVVDLILALPERQQGSPKRNTAAPHGSPEAT